MPRKSRRVPFVGKPVNLSRRGIRRMVGFTAKELHDLKVLASGAKNFPGGPGQVTTHSALPWFESASCGSCRTHDINGLVAKIEKL